MTRLAPRLDVLPAAQRALWPELAARKLTAHATRDVEVRALPKRSERLDG